MQLLLSCEMLLRITDSFAYKVDVHCSAVHCYPHPFTNFAHFFDLSNCYSIFSNTKETFCKLSVWLESRSAGVSSSISKPGYSLILEAFFFL